MQAVCWGRGHEFAKPRLLLNRDPRLPEHIEACFLTRGEKGSDLLAGSVGRVYGILSTLAGATVPSFGALASIYNCPRTARRP